jgi:hypothetical protein
MSTIVEDAGVPAKWFLRARYETLTEEAFRPIKVLHILSGSEPCKGYAGRRIPHIYRARH